MDYVFDVVEDLTENIEIVSGGGVFEWLKKRAKRLLKEKDKVDLKGNYACSLAGCDICKEGVAITPDGWMVPCNKFWEYKIGNVLEEEFGVLYRESQRAKTIRNLCNKRSDQLKGCETCEFAYDCAGGCRAEAYSTCGELMSPNWFNCTKRYIGHPDDALWCTMKPALR
jgi:radical SAM protein with 4Fe4S-binding SPASM domain